MSQKQGK